MIEEVSLQMDDYDALGIRMSFPNVKYEWTAQDYELFVTKYKNLINFNMERYLNKDNEMFQLIWRTNGDVPERTNTFYQHFPKVATNYESDHHVANFINVNHFYLGRWLPKHILTWLFPFEEIIYDDGDITKAKKLNSKSVPTINECRLCERFRGKGIWNRSGEWFCLRDKDSLTLDQVNSNLENLRNEHLKKTSKTIKNESKTSANGDSQGSAIRNQAVTQQNTKSAATTIPLPNIQDEKLDLNKTDELGPLYFNSFNDVRKWNQNVYERKVLDLESKLLKATDSSSYSEIEAELKSLRQLKKSGSLNPNLIITVKG